MNIFLKVLRFRGNCKTTVPQKIDDFAANSQGQLAGPSCADENMPEWAGEEARREVASKGRFYGAHEFCICLFMLLLAVFAGCSPCYVPPMEVPCSLPAKICPDTKVKHHVVIDPGHGGKDCGTNSQKEPKYQEKDLNLATAKHLQRYLRQLGYNSELTRHEDVFVALDNRATFANTINPGLFVSLHYNSAPNSDAEGIEVFYYNDEKGKRPAASKKLGEIVLKRVTGITQAKTRGVRHGNYAVIRETKMPAILVEGGFLTNDKEKKNILSDNYQRKLAWGIAMGIDDYFKPMEH